MKELIEYKTPQAQVCGVFWCENVADTVTSPVRTVNVEEWKNGGETVAGDGGDIYLSL
jgi:hypothetical protein